MTRECNPQTIAENLKLMLDKSKGIKANLRNPAAFYSENKKSIYCLEILYDTRDGEILSCSTEIPESASNASEYGLVARAVMYLEDYNGRLRIRKLNPNTSSFFTPIKVRGKTYLCASCPNEKPKTQTELRTPNQYVRNNLLETVLKFNKHSKEKCQEKH